MAGQENAAARGGTEGGLSAAFTRLADGMGNLLSQHLQLAKLEAAADAKAVGLQLAKMAVYLPFVIVGYALLSLAAAVALARLIPLDLALLAVALVNLAGGGVGLWAASRKLKEHSLLSGSLDELGSSATLIRSEATHGR